MAVSITPISNEQSIDFNAWLAEHNLCKTAARKRMRVYRKVSMRYRKRSQDFVYVVSADDYRDQLETVQAKLIELSQQVMDEAQLVKNAEYEARMIQVEHDLLMNHHIRMNWQNGKSATFYKINHVITDPDTLSMLEEAAKNKDNYDVENLYLERFRMGAILDELGVAPPYGWKDWNKHLVIVQGGKVLCAYDTVHMQKIKVDRFKVGIQDKFGYNLKICEDENLKKIIQMAAELPLPEGDTGDLR